VVSNIFEVPDIKDGWNVSFPEEVNCPWRGYLVEFGASLCGFLCGFSTLNVERLVRSGNILPSNKQFKTDTNSRLASFLAIIANRF